MADHKFTLEEILNEYSEDGRRSGIRHTSDKPLSHGTLETEKLVNAATSSRPLRQEQAGYDQVVPELSAGDEEQLVDIKSTISHIKADKAAQAASWSAQAANAATAQVTGTGAAGPTPVKGPFQSFPYWAVCWLLFFLLMFLFGAGPFAALIFFTIPIYHWVARALDGDWARGDIQVGPAPVAVRAQGKDTSAEPDADVATAATAEPIAKESDE